jgi:NAD(P)H dehydrogenase (quinone)
MGPGGENHDRVSQHIALVDAAAAAGAEVTVYLPFLGAAPEATFPFARDHWHTEGHIRSTGLRHTFLRHSLYIGLLPTFAGPHGVIRGPAGDGRMGAVSRDDIADVSDTVSRLTGRAPTSCAGT